MKLSLNDWSATVFGLRRKSFAVLAVVAVALACAMPLLPTVPAEPSGSVTRGGLADVADNSTEPLVESVARGDTPTEADAGTLADPGSTGAPGFPTWDNGASYREGEVVVGIPEGATAADVAAAAERLGVVEVGSVSTLDRADRWVRLALAPGVDVARAIRDLEASGAVDQAQPNFVYTLLDTAPATGVHPAAASGGAAVAARGGLQLAPAASSGSKDAYSPLWHLSVVGAYKAWATRKVQGSVTVAVIDSGCDSTHPDLKQNIVAPYNALTGGSNVSDGSGHGTHVAGIIAAVPDNGIGVAGVSYNARIMPIKVISGQVTDTIHLVRAYDYILKNRKKYNVRVVNMSLGAAQSSIDAHDSATLRSIDEAYQAGVLSVFAAGNNGEGGPYYCFPCDFAETGVGVISLDARYAQGRPNASSNYNVRGEKTKDLSAPGEAVVSTMAKGSYGTLSGTSMATPVVSGAAALVFAANPSLTAGEAKSVLCTTARDLVRPVSGGVDQVGFDDYTGYGLVQADAAVAGANSSYLTGPDAVKVGGTVRLSAPRPGAWKWSSDTTSVATVNKSTGKVKGVSAGEAVISATNGTTTLRRTVVVYSTSIGGASVLVKGKTAKLVAKAVPVAMWTYASSKPSVAKVGGTTGIVTGKKAGKAVITATLTACPSIKVSKAVTVKAKKSANPMAVKVKAKTVKYSKVKKKAATVKGAVVFAKKARGAVTYARVARGSSAKLTVNGKTGAITVKKGTKRGAYTVKVKVKAAGTAVYKAATKTVTVKVKVA